MDPALLLTFFGQDPMVATCMWLVLAYIVGMAVSDWLRSPITSR